MRDDPNAAFMAQVKALEEAKAALDRLNIEDFAVAVSPVPKLTDRLRTATYALGWKQSGGMTEPVRMYFVMGSQKVAITIEQVE